MSKILKIYLLERVYRKVSKIFYNNKFDFNCWLSKKIRVFNNINKGIRKEK